MAGGDRFGTFVAIDWSGAVGARQPGIAVAACVSGDDAPAIVRPGHVWSRAEVLHWLTDALPPDALVGLDLGASLPFADAGAFFPGWRATPPDARTLWSEIDQLCAADAHLGAASFVDHPEVARHLRRHGARRGEFFTGGGRLRITEIAQREAGLAPYSNLNLVGAAQVGKSSFTGMRVLARLGGRVPVWPFDRVPNAGPVIVEIYTSLAALAAGRRKGRTKMRTVAELNAALAGAAIASRPVAGDGAIDDHRSDALLAAAWLRRAAPDAGLWAPAGMTARIARTEGWTFGIA